MDDPRNYQYDESDSDSNQHYHEQEPDPDKIWGTNPEEFKTFLKKEETVESVQEMKKTIENIIEMYSDSKSPEVEKHVGDLKEKLHLCDNKISELETESKDKGKGKAK